jgi:uncharacterized protein (TIGR02466 family)
MSTPSWSVLPIFATPLAVIPLPEAEKLNPVVAQLLAARAASDTAGAARGSTPLCYRSAEDLLEWPDEAVRKVGGEVLRGVCAMVAAVNDFTEEQMGALTVQARGSFSIVRPDGGVKATHYPLTAWCGVYCVAAPEPSSQRRDSGMLRLYESRLGTMFSDATNSAMRIPFTPGHYAWRPVPGKMAVFPAWIQHEIALIRSAGELVLITVRARFVAPGQQGQAAW